MAVGFLTMSTGRTGPAGMARVHQDQAHTSPGRLVGEELPQVSEGPGMPLVALLSSNRCPLSDACQVFQRECLARYEGFLDQSLADAVVDVSLKAALSPAHLLQAPLGRLGTDLLEYLAALVGALAHSAHLRAGKGLAVAIGGQIHDAQVHAQMLPIIVRQGWRGLALGDMQIVDATLPDQISPAKLPGRVNQPGVLARAKDQAAHHTPGEGVERNPVQAHQAVGAGVVADGASRAKGGAGFLALRLDGFDGFHGFGSGTDGQLRAQAKARARFAVDAMVGGIGVGDAFLPAHFGYPGGRFIKGFLGRRKIGFMAVNIQLDANRSSECFAHKQSIQQPSLAVNRKERGASSHASRSWVSAPKRS